MDHQDLLTEMIDILRSVKQYQKCAKQHCRASCCENFMEVQAKMCAVCKLIISGGLTGQSKFVPPTYYLSEEQMSESLRSQTDSLLN